jgi:hypothetical protein
VLILDVEGRIDSRDIIAGDFFNQIRLQKPSSIADEDGKVAVSTLVF